jgi:hypothetical protein
MGGELIAFVVGVIASLVVNSQAGWWLNTGYGVGVMLGTLFVLGIGVGGIYSTWGPQPRGAFRRGGLRAAVWLSVGAIFSSAAFLFHVGPGNIFPIVLFLSAALTLGAVFAGSALVSVFH